MTLRAIAFLLALFLVSPAAAQEVEAAIGQAAGAPPPITGLTNAYVCASLGRGEDLSDIDTASCRKIDYLNQVDTQNRIIWLTGRFRIAEGYPGPAPLGLYTGALAARDLWWNGERIGSVGRVGSSRETEIPGDLDALTWVPPHLIRTGDNEIAIRYSTFHLAMHVVTPVHYVQAGRMGITRSLLREYGPGLAATGALIAAALFFGFTYLANPRAPGPLFITLMSLFAVGQLWLESLRGFTSFAYPLQIWRLSAVGVLAFGFGMALVAYVAHRFAHRRWLVYVAAAAAAALVLWPILPGFDGMALGFILGPSVVALVGAVQGVRARLPGAAITSLALVIFLALQFIENALFLNRTFYIAVSLLMLALIVDQARVLRRTREAEEQARRRAATLELELLRRRIAPHFLMNTLNALAEWVESDPKTGVRMIEALAEEFRLLSQISDRLLIPLSEEIALCRRHLAVMSYRVDRAFSLSTRNVDETAEVPPGVLHTLVENAFTHGRFADGGEFVLTREAGEGDISRLVLITPPSTQPEPREAPARGGGEGLAYVRRRLEAAFGASAQVESAASGSAWRTVLTIPRPAT
ncbi:MAG TPA: histidine kinase [Hyphomonadaceae bacterium]|nr:histidine kinase [Hyphomonadaceae bacterium]